ncbi:54S ribosomal protein L25, mitochondrial [Elasticomyces elasticus]|uniref:54S ribosomal protein L25, mitochondrial n=1 Tax=Exophiala sideris TaxID=1016849 RepID=A0ABR0J3K1_9EURO|nr:54S ribosomal protein L25, mitochondrial [Elasticomyces elasticus]KAK5024094.1 54S ribosomal protein L25, mitochondrial [Exophiala sideris]KAK5029044.1 54S ribosomal protein L25, mitochondrial [Exophiala sideris]KAK5054806.1 54S ribosomal protein L25, mitochondrial [Exophiala sideris]KAK5178867.1 54S ribosomal protein L25, mitochondrial [Eurotiomycetes sp. CCFEE 6388]
MAATTAAVAPGLKLPKRLIDFFARFPPEQYSAKVTGITLPLTRKEAREAARTRGVNTGAPAPVQTDHATADVKTSDTASISIPRPAPSSSQTRFPPNPFLPRKNFETGRWAGARIGLRRQAELVKMAKKLKIEELLPPGRKSTEFKQARLLDRGLRVKGTGEGQKVKGHKWERHIGANLEKRRTAMENMPELVQEWKRRGHGRGWKKYPK